MFFETERLPLRKTKGKYLWKLLLGQLADTKNYTESTVHADSPTVALQQKPACVTMPCRVLKNWTLPCAPLACFYTFGYLKTVAVQILLC